MKSHLQLWSWVLEGLTHNGTNTVSDRPDD